MASPSSIISLGLGSWGSPSDVITLGYGSSNVVIVPGPFIPSIIVNTQPGTSLSTSFQPGLTQVRSFQPTGEGANNE